MHPQTSMKDDRCKEGLQIQVILISMNSKLYNYVIKIGHLNILTIILGLGSKNNKYGVKLQLIYR